MPVRPDLLDDIWPTLRPMFEEPVKLTYGRMEVDDILTGARNGGYLIWIVVKSETSAILAAFTTRIATYPRRRALAVDFLSGSQMDLWLETVLQKVSEHAHRCETDLIEGFGRKGWERTLRKYNWTLAYPTYQMDLRQHGQG